MKAFADLGEQTWRAATEKKQDYSGSLVNDSSSLLGTFLCSRKCTIATAINEEKKTI